MRGARHISRATGVIDLRNVLMVRRAFQVIPRHEEQVPNQPQALDGRAEEEEDSLWAETESYSSDHEDIGGEEGLMKASNRQERKVRRAFELVLTSGRVIRFEVSWLGFLSQPTAHI